MITIEEESFEETISFEDVIEYDDEIVYEEDQEPMPFEIADFEEA